MYGLTNQTEDVKKCVKLNSDGTSAEVDTTITNEISCNEAGYKWVETAYEATHTNIVSSTIKNKVDEWYENNIQNENDTSKQYEKYLADTIFCGDKSLAENGIGGVAKQLGYNSSRTFYKTTERLVYSTGSTNLTTLKPTFECAKTSKDNYSRYTSKLEMNTKTTKNVDINNDLKHPIALLSADEAIFAGAYKLNSENKNYYLYKSGLNIWFLMTPYNFGTKASIFRIYSTNGNLSNNSVDSANNEYARPCINLKSTILKNNGNGTLENPYTIKLN